MANHDNCRDLIGQFSGGGASQVRHRPAQRGADSGLYGLPAADEGGTKNESRNITGQKICDRIGPLCIEIIISGLSCFLFCRNVESKCA